MPRYLSLVRIQENTIDMEDADPGFQERMGALFEEITKAGVMLDTAGLHPTAESTRLTWSDGKVSYTDGPFTETKEVVGGYALMQCKDKAEALEWSKRFLEVHPKHWTVGLEVREVEDMPQPDA
ncbi:dgpfaetke domain-containing protein [Streptomyces laurentii]|uniref:Dgpfaetke domain-containing protein n=1 Tax=Streptomyces laurentii TaxID=39478 RepID=A0A160P1Z6_STRLU|nr:dgpfaetke domain-containing protein [Streptomyces laurentii]